MGVVNHQKMGKLAKNHLKTPNLGFCYLVYFAKPKNRLILPIFFYLTVI